MFSKLNIIYGVLTIIFGVFSIYSLFQLDTILITVSIPIFIISLTNMIVFDKLNSMKINIDEMKKNINAIKDEIYKKYDDKKD